MDYEIVLRSNWTLRFGRLLHPGTYRVPEDLTPEEAERALLEADASRSVVSKGPAPLNKLRGKAPSDK